MRTIKRITCISICLLLLTQVDAQRFKAGAHIGLLTTQIDGDEMSGYRKPGLFIGMFGNLPFPEKKIKLQLEIDYAQKGSRSPGSALSRYRIVLHQVEVPLLFGWNFWKNVTLEAGPSFNVIASAKEYVDNVEVAKDAGGSRFYLFEAGGIAGLNYHFKEHFGLSFRMNYSLSPIGRSVVLRDGRKLERYMMTNAMLFRFYYQF